VSQLRKKVQEWRDGGYIGSADTSRSLLNWWFNTSHLMPQADGTMAEFQYYFAQREALETIVYLYDVVGVQDKFDLLIFTASMPATTFPLRPMMKTRWTISSASSPVARPSIPKWIWA
jgi:hypothetical protein